MSADDQRPGPSEADRALLQEAGARARPLNREERDMLAELTLPAVVDYSEDITLVRNQGGAGGSVTLAGLALLDILKEREAPFSPDASFRFAAYVFNDSRLWHQDPRITEPGLDPLQVLERYGGCPETCWPSNFDGLEPGAPDRAVPPDECFDQAQLARLRSHSDPIRDCSVDDLQRLLYRYGPLFAAGDVPGSPAHGHAFVLIGYDDYARSFTVLNSYGDTWGDNGMLEMPYASIEQPPADQSTPRVDWVRWAESEPTPVGAHPFTARVRVRHAQRRNLLTIRIGVEGRDAFTVWDRPNQATLPDDSQRLALDLALPAYAGRYWPPSRAHQWYLEVIDTSEETGGADAGTVEECLLVERLWLPEGQCVARVAARTSPRTFAAGSRVQIPFSAVGKVKRIHLEAERRWVHPGEPVVLHGSMVTQPARGRYARRAKLEAEIYRARLRPDGSTWLTHAVGKTAADRKGRFEVEFVPEETADYRAIITKPDGTMMGISDVVRVVVE